MAGLIEEDEPLYPPLSEADKARHRQQAKLWDARNAALQERIVTDPSKLDGEAHIKGSRHTISDIRAARMERGALVPVLLKRFKGLTPDDIKAALFHWNDPNAGQRKPEPGASYIAEWDGPPRRRIYLYRVVETGAVPDLWQITGYEIDTDGMELPYPDAVDEGFDKILLYTTRYAPRDVVWRDEATGHVVDIYSLTGA